MNKRDGETQVMGENWIAGFGEARLVRIDGRLRLVGGAMADRMEAMEWVAMFLPGERVEGVGTSDAKSVRGNGQAKES